MPSDQRVGLDDSKDCAPFEESSELGQRKANGIGSPSRFLVSLDVERELFAQKQIFGGERRRRSEAETEESQNV